MITIFHDVCLIYLIYIYIFRSVQCWLYLIRKFPEKLLEKEHLTSYHNCSDKPYRERSERDINIKAIDDLSY